jgi:transposase-like protein
MATDPKRSVAPNRVAEVTQAELERLAATGLGEMSVRDLLGALLTSVGVAERRAYLDRAGGADKGNGSYERSLMVGSLPVEIEVPRTRSGGFRPRSLPPRFDRGYSEETQALLLGLLASARSVNAAKMALRKMGLSSSEDELDSVATNLVEELDLRNTRPVDPDLIALFLDGKYVEVREADRLRPCCIYVVVGLGRDGKRRVLSCLTRPGRENLEDWKLVLRSLIERGLRRVLLVVQDDFSGLLPITKGLFAKADVQLCIVHMQRNAKSHLSKADAAEFLQRIRCIKLAWDEAVGAAQFEQLCERFAPSYPHFIAELRKKREHYLAFLRFPERIRRPLSTTNLVEAINGQLEVLRRNSGGYFQSEESMKLKLGLVLGSLEAGRWRRTAAAIEGALDQLNALFEARFENEAAA